MQINSSYLHDIFDKDIFRKIINNSAKFFYKIEHKFQGICFTGASGMLIAPILCYKLDKYPILVRKPAYSSHSSEVVEGASVKKYIIVDDIYHTGKTINYMLDCMEKYLPKSKCVGIYLYYEDDIPEKIRGIAVNIIS